MPPAVDGRCEECGFDYDASPRHDIAGAIRASVPRFERWLREDAARLRAHPRSDVWSALEYACHVRDVFNVQRERICLAVENEEPAFESMRREERVIEERYNDQPPDRVARELAAAATALVSVLESLRDEDWTRTGRYNYPTERIRDVGWIGRHTVHETEHHLLDIERLMASTR